MNFSIILDSILQLLDQQTNKVFFSLPEQILQPWLPPYISVCCSPQPLSHNRVSYPLKTPLHTQDTLEFAGGTHLVCDLRRLSL